MFVYDYEGDIVNLSDKNIEVQPSPNSEYESCVVAQNSQDIIYGLQPYILHFGTSDECRKFVAHLSASLNILKVQGISSTMKTKDINTVILQDFQDMNSAHYEHECNCDNCHCNCS